jgi:hypothetical protein
MSLQQAIKASVTVHRQRPLIGVRQVLPRDGHMGDRLVHCWRRLDVTLGVLVATEWPQTVSSCHVRANVPANP